MAVGDIVALEHFVRTPALWAPELHGVVNAVVGADSTVIWQNGVLSTVPTALLREVLASTAEFVGFLGKYVQLRGFPNFAGADLGGEPKTPAASGVVIDVFTRDNESEEPRQPRALIATEDGAGLLLVDLAVVGSDFLPSQNAFVENGGRRNV